MRIVVAPDKFKGTLSATGAARAMAEGARRVERDATITVVALGDGGEGSLQAMVGSMGGEVQVVPASDPRGRSISAPLAFLVDGTVFVESATASGLGLLDVPDALRASSRGTGELILRAVQGAGDQLSIVVGIGGTASTDGGTGAAAAVGWRFLDARGADLPPGGAALAALDSIDAGGVDPAVNRAHVVGACDVVNSLTGADGAAWVFGPQKGASPADVGVLEAAMERLAEVVRRDLGVDIAELPHGGAGGGLGAGLAAFFGAELTSGFQLIAGATRLAERIRDADLVLTGEGRLDASTTQGKAVAGVARLARSASVDCIAIAGEVDSGWEVEQSLALARVVSLADRYGRSRALADTASCIAAAVADLLSS